MAMEKEQAIAPDKTNELSAEIENLKKSLQIERQNSQLLAETIVRMAMKLTGMN